MYIAYSALQNLQQPNNQSAGSADNELVLRYQAYQTICSKYHHEIAAIQKYLPGWQPKFY